MHRNRNMVSSSSRRRIVERVSSLGTNRMVSDDDDHCPTVWASVMAGTEPPGVDDHEPVPGGEGIDGAPNDTGRDHRIRRRERAAYPRRERFLPRSVSGVHITIGSSVRAPT